MPFMKKLIIFGRSPFINKIDLNIDYDKYDVLCINYPIPNIKVHYLVSCDEWVKPTLAPKTEWISVNTGWDLHKTREFITEEKHLSWLFYSSSAAVNFAILRGYKEIYLCGVDLIPNGKPFKHYDGIMNNKTPSEKSLIEEQEYIKELCRQNNVIIYNVNPKVKWVENRGL